MAFTTQIRQRRADKCGIAASQYGFGAILPTLPTYPEAMQPGGQRSPGAYPPIPMLTLAKGPKKPTFLLFCVSMPPSMAPKNSSAR